MRRSGKAGINEQLGKGGIETASPSYTASGIGDRYAFRQKRNVFVRLQANSRFRGRARRLVDLQPHLEGEIFEPLKDINFFKTVSVNPDLDTIVWQNNADFSPDFLYEISESCSDESLAQK
jgi:hypothetical protein